MPKDNLSIISGSSENLLNLLLLLLLLLSSSFLRAEGDTVNVSGMGLGNRNKENELTIDLLEETNRVIGGT